MMPVSSLVSSRSTPSSASHRGTAERRPRAATTRSASNTRDRRRRCGQAEPNPGDGAGHRRRRCPTPEAVDHHAVEQRDPVAARTVRRSTHSKVVRRQASTTRSSSPGSGIASVISSGRSSVKRTRWPRRRSRSARARRGTGPVPRCAGGPAGRGSAAPVGRPVGPTRRRRRDRGAGACRPARARSPRGRPSTGPGRSPDRPPRRRSPRSPRRIIGSA